MKCQRTILNSARCCFSTGTSTSGTPQIPSLQKIKRFYKKVDVIEHPDSDELPKLPAGEKVTLDNLSLSHDKYYAITLDGRVAKTFYKDQLAIPSRALAIALAEEWDA